MSRKRKTRPKGEKTPAWMKSVAADILAGTISGLIVAAILKLLGW